MAIPTSQPPIDSRYAQKAYVKAIADAVAAATNFKVAVVVGAAAATNIPITGIATEDKILGVVRLDRDATAANINMTSLTSEASITSAGNIQISTTVTTGDALLVLWADKSA